MNTCCKLLTRQRACHKAIKNIKLNCEKVWDDDIKEWTWGKTVRKKGWTDSEITTNRTTWRPQREGQRRERTTNTSSSSRGEQTTQPPSSRGGTPRKDRSSNGQGSPNKGSGQTKVGNSPVWKGAHSIFSLQGCLLQHPRESLIVVIQKVQQKIALRSLDARAITAVERKGPLQKKGRGGKCKKRKLERRQNDSV